MAVAISNEQDEFDIGAANLENLARHVLSTEGVNEGLELSVAVVDEGSMSRLNERYAGRKGPTDVLAFPLDEAPAVPKQGGEPTILGDVILCADVAAAQADERGSDLDAEMSLLLVHGILHLLGYDHGGEEEAAEMKKREDEILAAFGRGEPQ